MPPGKLQNAGSKAGIHAVLVIRFLWHGDEHWSELIMTCSVRDSSYIACRHDVINILLKVS